MSVLVLVFCGVSSPSNFMPWNLSALKCFFYLIGSALKEMSCVDVDIKIFKFTFWNYIKNMILYWYLHFPMTIAAVREKNSLIGIWVGNIAESKKYRKYSKGVSGLIANTISKRQSIRIFPEFWLNNQCC